ncbi:MAG: tetratricopeptide repeat protein, partial [Chitinophagales bacterium]|nr:tetratricopeptide repeat protein [Chitinophagales bacterium]
MKLTKLSLFLFSALLMLLWGCSTTNHAILPTQAFLDITSHYNAYFNSNEKLKNVYKLSLENHKDKFDSVIPVLHYSDSREFASYTADLDDVVKRSTLAIQLRGASNWSDDHFLLIGQANYLKGDYDKASASFKYITTEYKEGVDYVKVMKSLGKPIKSYVKAKKKKKKPQVKQIINKDGTQTLEKLDNRPSFSLWLHEPARSEALLWLIKTYTRQKKFEQASTVVTFVRGDDFFYKNLDPQLDLVEGDLRVSQKDYSAAIEPLEKYVNAKKIKKRKKLVVRPHFVLAQCYALLGNNAKAIEHYKKVLKCNPNYDMEFYAKIKMAKLGRSGSNNAEVRSLLAKMAKDGKYKDYWDQVYYELALISLAENNRADGRKFLHKSIDNSTTNDDQKATSFMKLAELDYEDEDYVSSKFFYDSTASFMAKNDVRYIEVDERNKVLGNLVEQLDIIAKEDSLQKLASLPEAERKKAVSTAVAKKEAEEEAAKEALAAQKQSPTNTNVLSNQTASQVTQTSGSTWYFYNPTTRATGYNDFIRKWGRRKLEDNWRRKNKASVFIDDDVATAAVDSAAAANDSIAKATQATGTVEEQMLAALPTTPDKMDRSVDRITDAYYNAGTIYKDGLESYPKAAAMFETLNTRYPKNKLKLESYYNLYLIALKQNDAAKAADYKSKILAEFPESVIAKILRDPNFINAAKQKEQEVDNYYQSAYNDFVNAKYDSTWYKAEMADNLFKPNPLSAKFQLLQALVLARQNRLADYVQALNKIVNKTKDAEVKKTASDLLSNLNKSSLPQIDLSKDSLRRDSLNAQYGISSGGPDTSQNEILQQLNDAKQQAIKSGANVKVDSGAKALAVNGKAQTTGIDTTANGSAAVKDTAAGKQPVAEPVVTEDTTSPYKRSDADIHYFVIYFKDPATLQSSIMSTMAKINAYNSSVVPEKRLQSKQVLIDSKNKLLNVRQFKNREDALAYFNQVKKQDQLFSDLKPEQYAITAISTTNFS